MKKEVIVILLVALALTTQIIFTFVVAPGPPFMKYPAAAKLYLQHDLPRERLLDFSPFYLWAHVTVQKLMGRSAHAMVWIQLAVAGLSILLLYRILTVFFSTAVSIAATLLFIFDAHVLIYGRILEPEPFLLLFLLGFLWSACCRRSRNHLLAGLFLALAILTRPTLVPLAAVYMATILFESGFRQQKMRSLLFFLLPILLATGVIWVRNSSVQPGSFPMVMNPSTVIYEGNHPLSNGDSAAYPLLIKEMVAEYPGRPDYTHVLYREFPSRAAGRKLTVGETNDFWLEKTLNIIHDNPGRWLGLLATKLRFAFSGYLKHDIAAAVGSEARLADSRVPVVPFSLISALALVGLVLMRDRWKRIILFYSVFALQLMVMLGSYVSARQRVVIIPLFVFFAAATIAAIGKAVGSRRYPILAILLVLVSLGTLLLASPGDLARDDRHLWQNRIQAVRLRNAAFFARRRGDLPRARDLSARALAYAPWSHEWLRIAGIPGDNRQYQALALNHQLRFRDDRVSVQFDRATLLMILGRYNLAVKILRSLTTGNYRFSRRFEQSPEPFFYLGVCNHRLGRPQEALNLLKRALERTPGDPYTLSFLYAITGDSAYRRSLERMVDPIHSRYFMGRADYDLGRYQRAVDHFAYVTGKLPEFRRTWIHFAAALYRCGKLEEAVQAYRRALDINVDPVFFEEEILDLFQSWWQKNPRSPLACSDYAVVLWQFGRLYEAMEFHRRALTMAADDPLIQARYRNMEMIMEKITAGQREETATR